jgi:uncharacterized protein (DUF2141 family)
VYPLLFLLLLLTACAKVGPPSGGPIDRTAPQIVSHFPAADDISVPLDATVEILFSEDMERERTEEALFVAPEERLHPRWQGRHLQLPIDLQPDRTYVITVGTGAKDLRGNALEKSFTFAFATGDRLNRGQIAGFVYRDHEPASGAYVWAYDLARFRGRVGEDAPHYRTQSGRDGSFAFARLAAGRYRLLAFADEDRDQSYDSGEWLGLPAADLEVSEADTARSGDLLLVAHEPPVVELVRVQAVDDRRLLLQFGAEVDPAAVDLEVKGLVVEELYDSPQDRKKVYARTGVQEPGREYSIAAVQVGGRPLKWQEPVRGSNRQDRSPPTLVGRFPEGGTIAPGDSLELLFGEGMEPVIPVGFWVETDSTQVLTGEWHWRSPTRLIFRPDALLHPGEYRLQGRGKLLADWAGLALGDSLVDLSFEVLAPDALAAFGGRVAAPKEDIWVTARDGKRIYLTRADSVGVYLFEGLPPGEYAVHVFTDVDGNGVHGKGQQEPYAPAEPYGRRSASVELTEGQMVEEIDLECR